MNAVGIDVSKGKSTVVILRPFCEVVASPYDEGHTESELKEPARFLKSIPGEPRVLFAYFSYFCVLRAMGYILNLRK